MTRTTVLLPEELKQRAERKAARRGISFGEMLRQSLERALRTTREEGDEEDPLFSDRYVYKGPAPKDSALAHDRHLYGGKS